MTNQDDEFDLKNAFGYAMITVLYSAFIGLITGLFALYLWAKHKSNYWKQFNLPVHKNTPFFGSLLKVFLYREPVSELMENAYMEGRDNPTIKNQSICGLYFCYKPVLMIREPELIKRILIKDFNYFSNRHSNSDLHSDMIGGANLFLVRNPFWKQMRARLTSTFTSARLKQMYYLMVSIGNDMNKFLCNAVKPNLEMELKEMCGCYTTDVITSCAFGVQANSIENPKSKFRQLSRSIFNFSYLRGFEFGTFFFLPELVRPLKLKFFTAEAATFFRETIKYVMNEREKSGEIKHDLIDTLITLKNEDENKVVNADELYFKGDALTAQATVFFSGGAETTSSLMSFALFEMALQPEIQVRLRQEIKEMLTLCNGQPTYENICEMKYLEMVALETIRMYPPLAFLDRLCEFSTGEMDGYDLAPYADFKIPNGMPVIIPIFALHRDPNNFPNPSKFDPERFTEENRQHIKPYTYLPFGTGPRACIGERFGLLSAKMGLVNFLKNHRVSPCERTERKMILRPCALLVQPKGGIHLNVERDILT